MTYAYVREYSGTKKSIGNWIALPNIKSMRFSQTNKVEKILIEMPIKK